METLHEVSKFVRKWIKNVIMALVKEANGIDREWKVMEVTFCLQNNNEILKNVLAQLFMSI